jgi:hypothetical protein
MNPFAKILVIRWVVAVGEEFFYVVRKGLRADDFQIIEKGQRDESTQDQQQRK